MVDGGFQWLMKPKSTIEIPSTILISESVLCVQGLSTCTSARTGGDGAGVQLPVVGRGVQEPVAVATVTGAGPLLEDSELTLLMPVLGGPK